MLERVGGKRAICLSSVCMFSVILDPQRGRREHLSHFCRLFIASVDIEWEVLFV